MSETQGGNPMEYIAGAEGPIIPDPDKPVDAERLAAPQAATDFFRANIESMIRFHQRAQERGLSGDEVVITLINVDDEAGGILADGLMPGHNWQSYRDAGERPTARGLAPKDAVYGFLVAVGYTDAAYNLANTEDLRVVVLDAGVALVMDVNFDENPENQ